jgi:phosphoglucosamine mutase
VLDCANGATTTVGPELFNSLGFETIVMGNRPDGRNINLGCGSTHPEQLAQLVVARGCAMGSPSTATAIARSSRRSSRPDRRRRRGAADVATACSARGGSRRRIVATVMSNIGSSWH